MKKSVVDLVGISTLKTLTILFLIKARLGVGHPKGVSLSPQLVEKQIL
jgi:hypothetical protein